MNIPQHHKANKLEQLIALLSDGKWHSEDELAKNINWQFGSIVYEGQSKGYSIETRKVSDKQFEYRIPGKTLTLEKVKALLPQLTEKIPYLSMLVVFGSRATGHFHAGSDWDFAALYDEESRKTLITNPFAWFEVTTIISQVLEIPDEKVDVVELNNCLPIIAHFVARDGKLLYEKKFGEFENFRKKALKSDIEMEELRKSLRKKIDTALQRWGV